MPTPILPPELAADLAPATLLVRGGSERTGYEETCEALFLTSGFVYGSAAEAEAAFKQDGSRYVYSRYRNPTVTMFEERLRLIEGAPACFATATGMAAVFTSLGALLAAGDRLVAARSLFGRPMTIGRNRGHERRLADGTPAFITIHPLALLRVEESADKEREYRAFVADLRGAAAHLRRNAA